MSVGPGICIVLLHAFGALILVGAAVPPLLQA
jgi:hypothetical protein